MGYSDVLIEQCGANATQEQQNNRIKWRVLWRLLQMMKTGFWKYLAAIIAMSVALSAFDTVTAFLLKDIMARIRLEQGVMFEGLGKNVLLCVLAGLGCLVVYGVGYITYTMEAKKGGANLQKVMYSKAMRLPFTYYDTTHSGEFMSKVMYDGERAQGIYGSRFRRILMPCLMVSCYLVPMVYLNWQVTLCLFGASASLLLVNALFVVPMQKMSQKLSHTHGSLTERLSNLLSGMEQVKIFGLHKSMVDEYVEANEQFRKGQRSMNLLSACLDGLNQGFELLGSLVFIALGVFFVSKDITTVENLAAIYVLYGAMSWNLLQVGIYIPSMASYLANAERVFTFLDSEEETERVEMPADVKSDSISVVEEKNAENVNANHSAVCMEHVSFSYDGEHTILDDFSVDIPKGKCIALKGESGKGKSTIAKLLLGFYSVSKGKLYLDGKPYESYTREQIRDQIGYVPQEPYLYDVSIAENIRYGKPDATLEEIMEAAKKANAHEFIMRQEHGYDTNVGERGNHLSGGERQRIAIARAILKDAPILLLDEATSALDNESEQLVNEALERLMEGRTTIVIAHRLSTLNRADAIVEL